MEDKDIAKDSNKESSGSFLRPSAFTSSSFVPPGRFTPGVVASNVFSGDSEGSHSNNPSITLANNPFASERQVTPVSSDSDTDDKRPVIGPSHFRQPQSHNAVSSMPGARCLLKPSILDKQTVNFKTNAESEVTHTNSSFKLEPPRLANPFEKENGVGTVAPFQQSSPEKEAPADNQCSSEPESAPVFLFGQNMEERVTAAEAGDTNHNGDHASTPNQKEDKEEEEQQQSPEAAGSSATSNLPPEQVEVVTGEESESNVFSLTCRLYMFDPSNQSWIERGRGQLHLNDSKSTESSSAGLESRLVMRTSGNLRVILNSKVWAGQSIARASSKSIRLSAYDAEQKLRVFLISASHNDADQIFTAIDWRIQQLKSKAAAQPESPTSGRKRSIEATDSETPSPVKKQRVSSHRTEESNDSVDPETEASNESGGSASPTVKSTSSESGYQ